MPEAEDSNNTTARWRTFHQSLDRIRQGRPDITDELAWRELRVEIDLALWGMSEGVPIDKFRYPWAGRMVDLVVLFRNKHLAYEDIQWQKVECNQEWLERRWPLPVLEAEAAPAQSASEVQSETLLSTAPPDEPAITDSVPAASAPTETPTSEFPTKTPTETPTPSAAPEPVSDADVGDQVGGASSLEVPAPVSPSPQEPTPIALLVKTRLAASAQETPARQELVLEWPSAEQLGIVKAPKQKAILRKWPELCQRYPNIYNADKVCAREVSGGQLAGHVGDVDPNTARAFLGALRVWLEQQL